LEPRSTTPNLEEEKMKRLVVMLMVLVFVGVGVAFAADTVTYDASQGKVTFNHKAHSERLKDCTKCHPGAKPAKIEVTKDVAHKDLCKKCHAEMGGPTKCGDCHKK
jgi:hypothetical protein